MGLLCVVEMCQRKIVALVLIRQWKIFKFIARIIKLQSSGMINAYWSTPTIFSLANWTIRTRTSCWTVKMWKRDPAIFDKKVAMLLAQLASKVSQTATLYESGNINLDKSKKIYWLAQCALYLSNKDCEKCIEYSISTLQRVSHAKQGARIFIGGSCNIRYETLTCFTSLLGSCCRSEANRTKS